MTKLLEVDASEFFADEGLNWEWCMEHANFSHQDACEFIIHVGDETYREGTIQRMRDGGCTEAFIAAYQDAAAQGAARILFYA